MYHHMVNKFSGVVKIIKRRTVMNPHWQSKLNCLKGQISLIRTMKLQTLGNACRSQKGESAGQKFPGRLVMPGMSNFRG